MQNVQAQERDAWSTVLGSVHLLIVIEPQPPFNNSVNDPDAIRNKDKPPYDHQHGDNAKDPPKKTVPECPDLPAKMTLKESTSHIVLFYVVHHNANNGSDAHKKRCSIEGINDRR